MARAELLHHFLFRFSAATLLRFRFVAMSGRLPPMYEAHSPSDAAACYSDAKKALYKAITIAQQLGSDDVAKRLDDRLAHIKSVFRSQFT